MHEITLPSGAVLKISKTPFAISKALYQAVLEELRTVKMNADDNVTNLIKELGWIGFASKKVEAALQECFKYCIYNNGAGDLKIDKDTFESDKARVDYSQVCVEVIEENIGPFTKGLFVGSSRLLVTLFGSPQ